MNSKYMFPIDKSKIPTLFLKQFEVKNPNFLVDEFEELILKDVMRFDKDSRIKLKRDMNNMFSKWMSDKVKKKENISLSIIGATRSGKSIATLKLMNNNVRYYNMPFDTKYLVCANQKEYRQKLMKAKFGTSFQIDENAFASVGEGSNTEIQQLKDAQNIIAKQNIHNFYITPKTFLPNNAILGLSYWGKDVNNWCSRFLLYSLKNSQPILLGYVVINVGSLFYDYGCFFNKLLGGCTNPNRLKLLQIKDDNLIFENHQNPQDVKIEKFSLDYLKYSSCIPDEYKKDNYKHVLDLINKNQTEDDKQKTPCPFYRLCKHPLCMYEHKKDKWIAKEMGGGMDERTTERFRVGIELIKSMGFYDLETGSFKIKATSKSDLKIKLEIQLPKISNSKFTASEKESIIATIHSLSDLGVFKETCSILKYNYEEVLLNIENGDKLLEMSKDVKDTSKEDDNAQLLRQNLIKIITDKSLNEIDLNNKVKSLLQNR